MGGVPCSIAARPPTVGRVRHTAKGPYGLPLAPAWVVSRPHPTALSLILSRFSAMSTGLAGPDEGGLKTHRLCSVGSEGVCGWLADGYHYPKTFGGQPESDIRREPVSCFTARQGIHVIGHRYPPTEVRMVQCGPASSVANPHVCPGPLLGQLSGGNWIARGVFRRLWLRRVPPGGASGSGSAPRLW